jgi:hypothetical protein
LVGGRRIDEAITYIDRIPNAPLTLRQVLDLENSKTENGHLHSVVQYNLLHISRLAKSCSRILSFWFDFDVGWRTDDKTILADYWTILQKQLH